MNTYCELKLSIDVVILKDSPSKDSSETLFKHINGKYYRKLHFRFSFHLNSHIFLGMSSTKWKVWTDWPPRKQRSVQLTSGRCLLHDSLVPVECSYHSVWRLKTALLNIARYNHHKRVFNIACIYCMPFFLNFPAGFRWLGAGCGGTELADFKEGCLLPSWWIWPLEKRFEQRLEGINIAQKFLNLENRLKICE